MSHAEFDKEQRKDRVFYIGALLFIALCLGWCIWDRHIVQERAAQCKARGGQYLNIGYEKYGCYKLESV